MAPEAAMKSPDARRQVSGIQPVAWFVHRVQSADGVGQSSKRMSMKDRSLLMNLSPVLSTQADSWVFLTREAQTLTERSSEVAIHQLLADQMESALEKMPGAVAPEAGSLAGTDIVGQALAVVHKTGAQIYRDHSQEFVREFRCLDRWRHAVVLAQQVRATGQHQIAHRIREFGFQNKSIVAPNPLRSSPVLCRKTGLSTDRAHFLRKSVAVVLRRGW